jgi:perosamine synthetase
MNFFHTYVSPRAHDAVGEVLTSTLLSEGKLVAKFEAEIQSSLGIKNLVALNSGTSALHLALVLAGIGEGDEVILPAQTFIASGLAIKYVGATPVFADIQYQTGNIDPNSVRDKITTKTKAIMVVHWAGYPCDMTEIGAIAAEYGIPVIEDAAHALGAVYKDFPIGAISELTCFSFQAIKHLTTGDGGGLAIANEAMISVAKKLRWFGIDRASSPMSELGERIYNADQVGFKFHMNDYAAALGLSNLTGFKERLAKVRNLADQYRNGLDGVSGVNLFSNAPDRQSACWLFGIHIERRNDFVRKMKSANIPVSVVHQRIDRNSVFGELRTDLQVQEKFDATQIHLPIHMGVNEEDIELIIHEIKKGW